jgi:NTE family protein
MHGTRETARAHSELHAKSHRLSKRPPFDCIALLLQGGGALGSYQAGVYEALAEANLHPDWVAGTSIGAINFAIIAGLGPHFFQRKKTVRYVDRFDSESQYVSSSFMNC